MLGQKGHSSLHWRPSPAALTTDVGRDAYAASTLWMVTAPEAVAVVRLPPVNRVTRCNSSGGSSMGGPRGARRASCWGQGLTEEVARCGGGGGGASRWRSWVAVVMQ
jgi:hypothetical protein